MPMSIKVDPEITSKRMEACQPLFLWPPPLLSLCRCCTQKPLKFSTGQHLELFLEGLSEQAQIEF